MVRKWQIHKLLFGPHVLLHMYGHSTHVSSILSKLKARNCKQALSFVVLPEIRIRDE
jgi:hypothetical protein